MAEGERDAWAASTRGTGELIAAALEAGASEVIVSVGGSATSDGGAGALEALEEAGLSPELDVLCDVNVPFEQAPSVFGPQKGADAEMVKRLERRLDELAAGFRRDPRGVPMTGCAGGLSGGLWAEHGARLRHGASFVLDTLGFDERMREAAFVVSGEGRIDSQTLQGKIVGELATRCRQGGVTCHVVVGRNELDEFSARILDLASLSEATTLEELEAVARAPGQLSGRVELHAPLGAVGRDEGRQPLGLGGDLVDGARRVARERGEAVDLQRGRAVLVRSASRRRGRSRRRAASRATCRAARAARARRP